MKDIRKNEKKCFQKNIYSRETEKKTCQARGNMLYLTMSNTFCTRQKWEEIGITRLIATGITEQSKLRGDINFGMLGFLLLIQPVFGIEFEKGDGAFRNMDIGFDQYEVPFISWLGHTGLYWDFLEYPPTDPWDQRFIQMQGWGLELNHIC